MYPYMYNTAYKQVKEINVPVMGLDPASAYDGCARLSTLDGWRRAAAVHGAWQGSERRRMCP